jgi:hypothetical protein
MDELLSKFFSLAAIVLLVALIGHLLARFTAPATKTEEPAESPLLDWTLSKQLRPLGSS